MLQSTKPEASRISPMPNPMPGSMFPRPLPTIDPADRAAHVALDADGNGSLSKAEARRAGFAADRFESFDANKDGQISEKEFTRGRQLEREFNKKDANNDGFLSRSEFHGFRSLMTDVAEKFKGGGEAIRDMMYRGPGNLLEKWVPGVKDPFAAADTNGDGQLSRAEYVASKHKEAKPFPTDIRPLPMPRPNPMWENFTQKSNV